MAKSLSFIKLNYSAGQGTTVSNTSVLSPEEVWVEIPGVGYTDFEKNKVNDTTDAKSSLTFGLDPRFAPSYNPLIVGGADSRDERSTFRMLTKAEKTGVVAIKLSQNKNDATAGVGLINYRDETSAPLPPGVVLGTGDEFYRIRFYQQLPHPGGLAFGLAQYLIAAEVLIVYNPSATDSWVQGVAPNRTMHKNVRHIQWQGYTYKTPYIDNKLKANVVHTSFHISDISLDDASAIHDGTRPAPVVKITMFQQPWDDDITYATENFGVTTVTPSTRAPAPAPAPAGSGGPPPASPPVGAI
jgi:hypothetical protein